jgi:hypothetical protein
MSTQQTSDWAQRLQAGLLELFDLKAFEKLRIAELSQQLGASYPVRFLERHHRAKKEIGLAQSVTQSNRWVTLLLHHCLLLTSESEHMTAMAVMGGHDPDSLSTRSQGRSRIRACKRRGIQRLS